MEWGYGGRQLPVKELVSQKEVIIVRRIVAAQDCKCQKRSRSLTNLSGDAEPMNHTEVAVSTSLSVQDSFTLLIHFECEILEQGKKKLSCVILSIRQLLLQRYKATDHECSLKKK